MFRGQGLAFAECREYQFGDDVRHIEWNATARLGRPFVKVFEEDRSATLLLLVDVSRSLAFGEPSSKMDLARELAALFALIGARSGERVGAVLFSDRIERRIQPRAGRAHGWSVAQAIADHQAQSMGTSLTLACLHAARTLTKPGTVAIFSDFMDTDYERALRTLRRRHDVVAIVPIAVQESSLPPVGLLQVRDLETGRTRWVDTASPQARRAHADRFRLFQRTRREIFARLGIASVECSTDRSYLGPLRQLCQPRGGSRSGPR